MGFSFSVSIYLERSQDRSNKGQQEKTSLSITLLYIICNIPWVCYIFSSLAKVEGTNSVAEGGIYVKDYLTYVAVHILPKDRFSSQYLEATVDMLITCTNSMVNALVYFCCLSHFRANLTRLLNPKLDIKPATDSDEKEIVLSKIPEEEAGRDEGDKIQEVKGENNTSEDC